MNIVNGKLKEASNSEYASHLEGLLADGEGVLATYKAINDGIVFTNKRIIAIDFKGITGKQVRYNSIHYKKIDMFFIETAGVGDRDTELEIWVAGESIHLNFGKKVDIKNLGLLLSNYVF
ncbi:PH domain-containing protein [Candidatus Epulonipiscium viviparus]|uniref:PH domain-containing protein n=1 Tax=Candidatus Epulonipiscium viviparus TaxID=420336 RepID=UPI00016C002C|nr:PH domain-containing protein [Candidatus Epulopiscium viviparus]